MTMVLAPHKGAKTRVKAQQERGGKPQPGPDAAPTS